MNSLKQSCQHPRNTPELVDPSRVTVHVTSSHPAASLLDGDDDLKTSGMLQFRFSLRQIQLFSSPSSPLITFSYTRGIQTLEAPKRLRDRVNSPGIAPRFALGGKDTRRRARVSRLLLRIDGHLGKGEWKNAWEFLYRRMELPTMADTKTRFDAYEHAAALFSSYERFGEAKDIQATMIDEGFVPSLALRTRMACIAVLTKGAGEEDLLELLQRPLADPDFTELALYQLIRFLGDTMDFSPSTIENIVQAWTGSHGRVMGRKILSYLIRFFSQCGQLDDAKALVQRSIDHGTTLDVALLTDLMTGFLRREHTDELTTAVADMQKENITPDLHIFNTIIFGHIKRLHFKDAIVTYNLLFESRGGGLTPDTYTFMNMFGMCLRALEPRRRVYSMRRIPPPRPRKLFNNLIECHLIKTGGHLSHRSRTLTTNVLNLALKLFMRAEDYEAAYVLLRTSNFCQVPANSATVNTLLRPVVAKIRRTRRGAPKSDTWLRSLLGSEWYDSVEANGTLFSLTNTDILERLWVVGSLGPEEDLRPKDSSPTFYANSVARKILAGNIDKLYPSDLKVLRRIVKRLFFAGTHRLDLDPLISTESIWKARVTEARRDMIPNMEEMTEYFASGSAGGKLKELSNDEGDKRIRLDLEYVAGGGR